MCFSWGLHSALWEMGNNTPPTSLQNCARYVLYLEKKEEIRNVKKPVVKPFDLSELFPCPPYRPHVNNLPGPGLPLFPDKGDN